MAWVISRYAHVFNRPNTSIAFNSVTLESFELASGEAELLSSLQEGRELAPSEFNDAQSLRAAGLVVTTSENAPGQALAQISRLRRGHHRSGRFSTLRLALTERCNMACTYCFQQALYPEKQPRMTVETLESTLDWFIDQARGDSVVVQYFGGEPLLEWPQVVHADGILERATAAGRIVGYEQNLTTNGTLMTAKRAEWLISKNVRVTFSFDGPQERNDQQRIFKNGNGTFEKASEGLRRFVDAGGTSAIMMTATPQNVEHLPELCRWLVEDSGFSPQVIGLNSPQPTAKGWETGGEELARSVFAIWTYCNDRGVSFTGPGTFIPLHLRAKHPQPDNCVDSADLQDDRGSWPIYVSADGRRSLCLVHHRDEKVELPIVSITAPKGSGVKERDWHRGHDTIPDCDSCIASQVCGGPCALERLLWGGQLNHDRCGFMREMTRQVILH